MLPAVAGPEPNRPELTMSSLEIAELTEKRHDNVMRDIRNMLEALGGGAGLSFEGSYKDARGRTLSCFNLPRRECTILISGYDVGMRAKIIDRWMALEIAHAAPRLVVDPSDPKVMLAVFGHLQKQVAEKDALLAAQGAQVKKLERIEAATGSMCLRDAAKTLGIRPIDLTSLLSSRRWIHKRPGNRNWIAYQDKIQAGYLEHAEHLYSDDQGRERVSTRALVTSKGLVKLSELLTAPLP
ncbi:phage regulatory protein/antirepressor Ant [Xanthobacter sp. DSM 24535]|uniref:Rha family transcriptional regulator n=1 Tax=Roseixanthobacter psychrophilus TaxID=3119917 RepID=UPI00372CB06A